MNGLEDLDPATLQALMELGVIDDKNGILQGQLQQANALRNSPTPQGRNLGYTYVASNPLEHLATGIQRYKGEQQQTDIQKQQQANLDAQTAARMKFIELLRGGQQTPMTGEQYG